MGEGPGAHRWWDGEQPCFRPEYPSEGAETPPAAEPPVAMTVQWDQYHRQLQTVRQWLERWQAFIVNDDGQYVEVDLETGRPAE